MPNRLRCTLSIGLVAVGFVVAYGRPLARLVRYWAADESYSHAFLIVPVAAYLLWQRRRVLAATGRRPAVAGLFLLVASVGVLVAGVLGAEVFLVRASFFGAIAGSVVFLAGWRHLRIVSFPLALLLLTIPVPSILFNQVAFPLQLIASHLGESLLALTGIPVLREGNVITLAHARLEVAEACSGIRSLMSLVALAVIYGYFSDNRAWLRVALAAVAIPVAILVNGLRIAGTGVLAQVFGIETAEGFFHAFSGWLMFLAAFMLLVAVHRILAACAPGAPREARGVTLERTRL